MARQPSLPLGKVKEAPAVPPDLLTIIRGILQKYGPRKQSLVAKQVGISEGHFSEALNGGPRHFAIEWLEHVKPFDFEQEIPGYFAGKYGLELRPPRRRSDSERLRRLLHVLHKHAAIGDAIEAEADQLPDDEFGEDCDAAEGVR